MDIVNLRRIKGEGSQWDIIALKLKLEGYKLKEIAEIVGKTKEAIKNDFKRGKYFLKGILQQMGYILK